MARYEHLPIYRDALNLAVHFEKIVANFSRYHKYTLGTELRNASRQAVKMVIHANNQTDKLQALQELREHLEELLLLIRLGKEVQAFKSFNAYSQVVDRRFDAAGLRTVLGQYLSKIQERRVFCRVAPCYRMVGACDF